MKNSLLVSCGAALSVLSPVWAGDGPVKIVPSPSIQVPLHLDWFSAHYDDVRDDTTFKTTGDPFGPGARFTAKLTFWRMAGNILGFTQMTCLF